MSISHSRGLVADSLDMASMEIVRARRACTVPQLLLRSCELPSLPNTHAVPKRYEETKPVKVQNFTHQKIMDLGELISRQARAETVKAHKLMIEKAVADTWEEADKEKVKAVEETLEKTQIKHEKQLRRLSKQHERALTEKALTVETMMQNKMREALEAERAEAAIRLHTTVEQIREQCAAQLEEAVIAAREEERRQAADEREQLLNEAAQTLQMAKDTLIEQKLVALQNLEERKDRERIYAVDEVRSREQAKAAISLADLRQQHSLDIRQLEQAKAAVESQIEGRDKQIEKIQRKREQLYDELLMAQADYQDFINKHPLFDPGQTKYLLPSIHENPNVINPYAETAGCSNENKMKSRHSTY